MIVASIKENINLEKIPITETDAMLEHPIKRFFLDAIDKEHRVWIENDVYEVVLRDSIPNDPKTGKPYRVMTTQPVFTTKLNPDNTINKFKYRLCVNGKHQNKDTQLCYESMVSIPSMRIAMDLAVRFNMDIISSDAQSFYLQAPIRDGEAYYMTLPAGWTNYDPKKYVLRLKKAVYGIPSSGQVAGRKLSNALKREGFFPTPHDPKFFFNWHSNTELSLALVHADDILWFTNARSIVQPTMDLLGQEFKLTFHDDPTVFRGIEIARERTPTGDSITLHQRGYLSTLSGKFNIDIDAKNRPKIPGLLYKQL